MLVQERTGNTLEIIGVGEDVGKKEPLYTADVNAS
jgi:hypothetical protein